MTRREYRNQVLAMLLLTMLSMFSCKGFFNREDDSETLKWMCQTSGIQIPGSTKSIDLYDNGEWGVISKFKLSNSAFDLFAKKHHMLPLTGQNLEILLLNEIENISHDQKFIQNEQDYLYHADCKIGNSWTVLGNKRTGEIWFEVLYPDWGGDMRPCDKDTINHVN